MKIVILDGYTATQDDLSWKGIEPLGDVMVYDRTCPEDVIGRCLDAEAVLTNKVIISEDVISHLPSLRYIGVLATGYNVVDVEFARNRGIIVTNIPAYSTNSVAQMVFAHILNATMHVAHYADENRKGRWLRSEDFCWMDTSVTELHGKTLGIVGLGNIGNAVARIGNAFGMNVVAQTSKNQEQLPEYVNKVSFDELLELSDIITLHCPLTNETYEIICADSIRRMKRGVIVVNTGRGPLVNELDMAEALEDGNVGAFCADVLSAEPPLADNPLLSCENAFVTPHIAWASKEARARLIDIAVENLRAFILGRPRNVII